MDSHISSALSILDTLIPLVCSAEKQLASARTWSFIDILGGDTFSGLIKHSKLRKVKADMDQVNNLLNMLSSELCDVNGENNYSMEISGLLTFADFFCDSLLVDGYITVKISQSLDQVRQLKDKLLLLKDALLENQ